MIYQCYFKKDHEEFLFDSDVYKGFGLEPDVNPTITKNCPELEDPINRLNLVEYAAFLNIYRNDVFKFDDDDWIGFTSYRQTLKTPIMFSNKKLFRDLLMSVGNGFCGWGYYRTHSNASQQSEICHPNINSFIKETLDHFNIKLPDRFYKDQYILFANYWAMRKEMFLDFMLWSMPIMEYALTKTDHPYTRSKSWVPTVSEHKWVGYYQERLFIIWYMLRNFIPTNFGPICGEIA